MNGFVLLITIRFIFFTFLNLYYLQERSKGKKLWQKTDEIHHSNQKQEYVLSTGVNVRKLIDDLPTKDGYLTLNVIDLSNSSVDIFIPTEYSEMRDDFNIQITKYLSEKIPYYLEEALELIFKVYTCLASLFYFVLNSQQFLKPPCSAITFTIRDNYSTRQRS